MVLEAYRVFKEIERRPAMWIGEVTLNALVTYGRGYCHALFHNNLIASEPEPFHDWVAEKLGYESSGGGWPNMILAYTMGFNPHKIEWETFFAIPVSDEQHRKSVVKFYELLEEYKAEMDRKATEINAQ